MLNFRSVADLNRAIVSNLHRLDRRQYDVVVGIPRSGMLPAGILSTLLQLPLSDVESYARGVIYGRSGRPLAEKGGRVLLVDDTCNHGGAMARAVANIQGQAGTITRFAVFGPYRGIEGLVDIYCEIVQGPRAFEWNAWKHARLGRWAIDLDGVLCRDPEKAENDDGPRYRQFIANAEPVFLPTRPVGHIVTCRLEKYRGETEAWLKAHGVEFVGMTMMQYATKAERMAAGGRGAWKAEVAKSLGVEFFIESDNKQAGIIAREAGIPVWCTTTQAVHGPP